MRGFGFLGFLALSGAAMGQEDGALGVSADDEGSVAVRSAVGRVLGKLGSGVVPDEVPQNRLPERDPAIPDKINIKSDDYGTDGDTFWAEGNVVVTYKGYRMTAQRIEGDRAADVFTLLGGGRLEGIEGESVTGETVVVNFKEESYTISDGKAVIVPERTQGYTTGPFYTTGGTGSFQDQHFHLVNGELTSCDKDHPHYSFTLRDGDYVPGDHIILRDVGVNILGRRVLGLPHLYIPLIDDRPRYLPEFGQSQDEGYYAKMRYITPLNGEDILESRLDLMTRLGVGVGQDYRYLSSVAEGGLGFYTIFGSNQTLVGKWLHHQLLGASDLNIDAQYNRNNYLTAPNTTTLSSRAQLTVPSKGGTTGFSYYRTGSDVGAFSSVNQNFSVSDQRRFGTGTRTNLNLTWADSSSISNGVALSNSERIDMRFQGTQELRSLTADLLYQRTVPVGGSTSFSGSSDRTPLLTLSSDARRLFGEGTGRSWPFRFSSSIGELQDLSSGSPITRMTFETDVRRSEQLGRDTTLAWNGSYEQGVYSDDTAQYTLNYGSTFTHRFGLGSTFNLSYRNLRQFGFTPLAIDRRGRNDVFNMGLQFEFGRGWGATAQTGYDLLSFERGQSPWQLVQFGGTYRGMDSRFRLTGVYDTFNQSFGTFRADGEWEAFGSRFAGALRYDGLRSTWAGASLQFEALKIGKISLDALLSYNGYTKQFDAQQYSLAYDLHCTEAVLEITEFKSGFRSGRQVAFFFRIKALPFGSDFGVGRRGQHIGGAGGFGN